MISKVKRHFDDHYLRGPHAVTRWHPKHGFTTLSRLQNLCFLHLCAFFPSHLCTHFPSGNLQTLISRHGVFPSYCAQSCSKLNFFGRHCRCLFEKTHSFLQFLFFRFAHGSFTSVGVMVVGAAVVGVMVVGATVVGAAVVGAAVFGDTSVPPLSSTVLLIQSYLLLTRAKTPGNPLSHTSFTKDVIPTTTSSSAFSPLLIKGPPVSP